MTVRQIVKPVTVRCLRLRRQFVFAPPNFLDGSNPFTALLIARLVCLAQTLAKILFLKCSSKMVPSPRQGSLNDKESRVRISHRLRGVSDLGESSKPGPRESGRGGRLRGAERDPRQRGERNRASRVVERHAGCTLRSRLCCLP